jgi:hypothetical protein
MLSHWFSNFDHVAVGIPHKNPMTAIKSVQHIHAEFNIFGA